MVDRGENCQKIEKMSDKFQDLIYGEKIYLKITEKRKIEEEKQNGGKRRKNQPKIKKISDILREKNYGK